MPPPPTTRSGSAVHAVQIFSDNPKTYRTKADRHDGARDVRARPHGRRDRAGGHPHLVLDQPRDRRSEDRGRLAAAAQKRSEGRGAPATIAYVNTHLGSYGSATALEGFASVVAALEEALDDDPARRLPRARELGRRRAALRRYDRGVGRDPARRRPSAARACASTPRTRGPPATRSTRRPASTASSI